MSGKVKPLLSVTIIIIALYLVLILFFKIINWLILLISPRILDIGCGGILLFLIWISAIAKSRAEIRNSGYANVFRWLGVLFVTVLFIFFYRYIDTLDTMQQIGCGFVLFFVLILIFSKPQYPSIVGDDEDDYHASR